MFSSFVARQPIFTKKQQVFAYELLFRQAQEHSTCQASDSNDATIQVLENTLINLGFEQLTNHHPAFVNFPADILMSSFITALPKEMIVIEILETVHPTPEIILRCQELKALGFRLALDDFIFSPDYEPLLPLADYIKIDFRATTTSERQALVNQLKRPGLLFLAEKVETHEEFQEALSSGYSLFQGYFFCKPEILTGTSVQINKHSAFLFMQELIEPEINYKKLENILRHDISLSYKILRFINSPYFGFRTEITSIHQALTLLGQKELYKWSALLVLSNLAVNKPAELLTLALVRARFAELIAKQMRQKNGYEFFLAGMFSLMDAFLNRSMNDIVTNLPIHEDVKDAMLGSDNTIGKVLRLIAAYEKADWAEGESLSASLKLSESQLAEDYYQAQLWTGIDTINGIT